MFEHRSEPLISREHFYRRLRRHGGYAVALVGVSLLLGTLGFSTLAQQEPIDALLTKAMLVCGMAPVAP
jgi:hypothetical protein